MAQVGYNWLFTNEADGGNSGEEDEEEDLEEIQSILYGAIHYEQMTDDMLPNTEFTSSDVAYELDLQEEITPEDPNSGPSLTSTPCHTRIRSGTPSSSEKYHSPSGSGDSEILNVSVPGSVSEKPASKKRRSDISVIDLVSESDSSAIGGRSDKFIVIDSISDDSDVEITAQMEKRRKIAPKKGSKAGKVIKVESDDSSLSSSSSSSDESDEEKNAVRDMQIHAHSGGRSAVMDGDFQDTIDIELDTTLEEIHDSLGECNWSLTDNIAPTQRSRTMSRYYTPFDVRCNNCDKVGHLSKLCPKPKKLRCCLCGEAGHMVMRCPQKLCHNCSKPGHQLLKCPDPKRSRYYICKRCGMAGHKKMECSEKWRQFHLSTTPDKLVKGTGKENPRVYCFNCGESGHWGYECEEERMTKFVLFNCPLITTYDRPSRVMPNRVTDIQDRRSEKSSNTSKGLKEKLKSYVSKARKASKQATNKVSHQKEENPSKMEYKYTESFPREHDSSRGHTGHKDRTPPRDKARKYGVTTETKANAKKSMQKTSQSTEKNLDPFDVGKSRPNGYSGRALRKVLVQRVMGTISKIGRKKIGPFSQYAKEMGTYEEIWRSAAACARTKIRNRDGKSSRDVDNLTWKDIHKSHEGSLKSPVNTKELKGRNRLKKFKEAAAERIVSAPNDKVNLQVQIKQEAERNKYKRMTRAAVKKEKKNIALGNEKSNNDRPNRESSNSKKRNKRGFRFDTTNHESKHWRKNSQGFRFDWSFGEN